MAMTILAPPVVLKATVTAYDATAWFLDDPALAHYGEPYQWTVTLDVETQLHGYTSETATPPVFACYDGTHVTAGMWLAMPTGDIVKIVALSAQSFSTVECTIEDVGMYNAHSAIGVGFFGAGTGVLFALDAGGNPIIDPLPPGVLVPEFAMDVLSRFRVLGITTLGGGGALTVKDEGNALPGAFSALNFVGASVTAAVDAAAATQANIFIPPPSYLSHMQTDDGSNGQQNMAESIVRVTARVSAPTTEGTPFKTGGWAGTDQPVSNSGTVTFTTPAATTGFGDGATMTVTVLDADGVTALAAFTTPALTANGLHANADASVSVVLTLYGADNDHFKAKAAVTVDLARLIPGGGRYQVKIVHTAGDGKGPFTYTQPAVFYDAGTAAPALAALSIAETAGQTVTKTLSGLTYYTTGSKFTVAASGIANHNANTQKDGASLDIAAGNFGLSAIAASPFGANGTGFTGWNNIFSTNNIGFTLSSGVSAANFRYAGGGATATGTVSDPFQPGAAVTSNALAVMIDTHADDSTALLETFNGESRRLKADWTTAWDSAQPLASGDALVFGGSLMVPNRAFVMAPQPGAHGGGPAGSLTDFSPLRPTQTANYTALGAPVNYYRKWTESPRDRASFTLAFSGSFPADALTALKNGDLQVFVYKLGGAGNAGVPPGNVKPLWLHGSDGYRVATFSDGNGQTNATATCRESTSAGNGINGTFGGFSMSGGIATRIVINNPAIRLDSIQATFY